MLTACSWEADRELLIERSVGEKSVSGWAEGDAWSPPSPWVPAEHCPEPWGGGVHTLSALHALGTAEDHSRAIHERVPGTTEMCQHALLLHISSKSDQAQRHLRGVSMSETH